jgi:hypothetical protein
MMDSKQLVTMIRTIVQSEMKKTLKPLLRETLKPILKEMVDNKVNEILAEKYVQSLGQNQQVLTEPRQQRPLVKPPAPSRIANLKEKYKVDTSPLGAFMTEGMEDHELRAMAASDAHPGVAGAEDDDDEGIPLDFIQGMMSSGARR